MFPPRSKVSVRNRTLLSCAVAVVAGLVAACGAQPNDGVDANAASPEPAPTSLQASSLPVSNSPAVERTSETAPSTTLPNAPHSSGAPDKSATRFSSPDVGFETDVPSGFELLTTPQSIRGVDGFSLRSTAIFVNYEEGSTIAVTVTRGLPAEHPLAPEHRSDLDAEVASSLGQIFSAADVDLLQVGATEIVFRNDKSTVVTVVGNDVREPTVIADVAASIRITSDRVEVSS